jgi:hypothetical protein
VLLSTAVQTLGNQIQTSLEEHAERKRNERWAEEAWQAVGRPASEDYAAGFHNGFTDYLWHGGNGEPPPLPPPKYRALSYQTPEGYRAIEEWFAGYRHGAQVAHQQGYRDLVTGPSSLRRHQQPPDPPPPVEALPQPGSWLGPLPQPRSVETLPQPRSVEVLPQPRPEPPEEQPVGEMAFYEPFLVITPKREARKQLKIEAAR